MHPFNKFRLLPSIYIKFSSPVIQICSKNSETTELKMTLTGMCLHKCFSTGIYLLYRCSDFWQSFEMGISWSRMKEWSNSPEWENWIRYIEVYLGPYQRSYAMKMFLQKSTKSLTIFAERSIIDNWQAPTYASGTLTFIIFSSCKSSTVFLHKFFWNI